MADNNQQQQQIQIKITDEVLKGVYANTMQVLHTQEEFMACKIAANQPLAQLQKMLGVSQRCHSSTRVQCLHNLPHPEKGAQGIRGAAIGYCQALFEFAGATAAHTEKVQELLREASLPLPDSHELFYGYRSLDVTPEEFVAEAVRPLTTAGRVPILITGLAVQSTEAESLFTLPSATAEGETMLIRVLLNSEQSIDPASRLLDQLIARSTSQHMMPAYWPLLQAGAGFSAHDWENLRDRLDDKWLAANVAVNPFTDDDTFEVVKPQVTVAQLPVGAVAGVVSTEEARLPIGMPISGTDASQLRTYNPVAYGRRLAQLNTAPTLIVLGPSQGWSDQENVERLTRFAPIMELVAETVWGSRVTPSRRRMVMGLSA